LKAIKQIQQEVITFDKYLVTGRSTRITARHLPSFRGTKELRLFCLAGTGTTLREGASPRDDVPLPATDTGNHLRRCPEVVTSLVLLPVIGRGVAPLSAASQVETKFQHLQEVQRSGCFFAQRLVQAVARLQDETPPPGNKGSGGLVLAQLVQTSLHCNVYGGTIIMTVL
jgi:hypothetical protein